MFTPATHQVAGHRATNSQLGPLVDNSGRFYKPLQDKDRGSKEVTFYQSFSSNPEIPPRIRRYFPKFYGIELVQSRDGSPHSHMVIEDITHNLHNPSIIDLKVGSRTWYPQSSEDYIKKCLEKDRDSTSVQLGFRVSGIQVFEKTGFWKPGRDWIKGLRNPTDVKSVLRRFVDCGKLASIVYGGSSGILEQLLELKEWFEDQGIYHFNSCSVLMGYEEGGGAAGGFVKLIDFAHVFDGDGVIDHNFLGGLCSLIKIVKEILMGEGEEEIEKGCLQGGSETNQS